MARISNKPLAEADLIEIWQYLALDNSKSADDLLDEISVALKPLLEFPLIGRDRSELAPCLRSFPVQRYMVFYRLLENKDIEVIRVLHASRDVNYLIQNT